MGVLMVDDWEEVELSKLGAEDVQVRIEIPQDDVVAVQAGVLKDVLLDVQLEFEVSKASVVDVQVEMVVPKVDVEVQMFGVEFVDAKVEVQNHEVLDVQVLVGLQNANVLDLQVQVPQVGDEGPKDEIEDVQVDFGDAKVEGGRGVGTPIGRDLVLAVAALLSKEPFPKWQ